MTLPTRTLVRLLKKAGTAFFNLVLLFPTTVLAADMDVSGQGETLSSPEARLESNRPPFEYGISVLRVFDAGIQASDTSFAYTEYAASTEMLFLLLSADHRVYEWDNGADLAGASGKAPWDSLTRITPGLQYFHKFGDWGVWPMLAASTGFEDNITSDSWTLNPHIVGLYMPTEDWAIYFGAGYLYHPVEPLPYPVFGLAFRHEEKTGLCGAVGFPETMLLYWLAPQWAVKADFGWDIRTYKLSRDNPVAPDGYLRSDDKVPGLHLEYRPTKGLVVSPGLRWYLDRKLVVYDENGDELYERNVGSAWSAVLQVGCEF